MFGARTVSEIGFRTYKNIGTRNNCLHTWNELGRRQMHPARNNGDIKLWPRTPRSGNQRTWITLVNRSHIHQCLELVSTTKPMVQPNAYLTNRPTSAVKAGKPRYTKANVIGNAVWIPSTMLTHGRAPVTGYFLHTPGHLFQIERVTWAPTHTLIFCLVMSANAIDIGNLGSFWLATRRHWAPATSK